MIHADSQKMFWDVVAQKIYEKHGGFENYDSFQIHCPCDGHSDNTPSCVVTATETKLLVHCHSCANPSDAFFKLKAAGEIPAYARTNMLAAPYSTSHISTTKQYSRRLGYAENLWNGASDTDFYFNAYCDTRGLLDVQKPVSIREYEELWHQETGQSHIALVAKIVNAEGEMVSAHRTYLNDYGDDKLEQTSTSNAKVRAKKIIARCCGGHVDIRFGTKTLHVAEGLETSLAVLEKLPEEYDTHAIWAAVSSANLGNLVLPDNVYDTVHIWTDHDKSGTGIAAAEKLATRLTAKNITCFLHVPDHITVDDVKSIDWLDVMEDIVTESTRCVVFEPTEESACNEEHKKQLRGAVKKRSRCTRTIRHWKADAETPRLSQTA